MNDELSIDNIAPKEVSDLTQEEKDYLNENKSQLNEKQLEKFVSVLEDKETNPAKDGDSDGDDKEETNE